MGELTAPPAISGSTESGSYHVHMGPEGPEEVPGQSCQFCRQRDALTMPRPTKSVRWEG